MPASALDLSQKKVMSGYMCGWEPSSTGHRFPEMPEARVNEFSPLHYDLRRQKPLS